MAAQQKHTTRNFQQIAIIQNNSKTNMDVSLSTVDTKIKIIEKWKNRTLRVRMNADWYIPNKQILKENGILTVTDEEKRLRIYTNKLAVQL